MSDSIYFTHQCHCLHLHSLYLHLSHTLNIPILFTAIPQQIMNLYFAFDDIQHTVTPFSHFWWDALPCSDPYWLNYTFVFLGLWTYLNTWRFTIFSTDSLWYNFKYVCSGFMCCLRGLISPSSWLVLWFFISGLVQVLLLNFVVKIVIFQ